MARLARFIVPGHPHHVTQRGNGGQQVFFSDEDYARYRDLLGAHCRAAGVAVWGWVLMPNHVHVILVPQDGDGVRRALSQVHRIYAGEIHARLQRTGHFWQGRFGCVAMDETHLLAATRYVALNPVRAGLVRHAEEWRWSSLAAWLAPETDDGITDTGAILARVGDMRAFLRAAADGEDEQMVALRRAESIGRPLGDPRFLTEVSEMTGRDPRPAKRGRKAQGDAPSPQAADRRR